MGFKTDYKGIHEAAYQRLRKIGQVAWSSTGDIEYRKQLFHQLLTQANINPPAQILILGAGDGEIAIRLAHEGFNTVGVDISSTAVAWAREKAKSANCIIQFFEGNVVDLSFLDQKFSAVIDDHCFHCIIGEDRMTFLNEVRVKLENKGLFIVRTQCGDPPSSESPEFFKTWNLLSRCQVHEGVAGRYFGHPQDILSEIQLSGFEVIKSDLKVQPNAWNMLEVLARKI